MPPKATWIRTPTCPTTGAKRLFFLLELILDIFQCLAAAILDFIRLLRCTSNTTSNTTIRTTIRTTTRTTLRGIL